MADNSIKTKTQSKYEQDNTIIVPSNSIGFEDVFLGEECWYAVSIRKERLPYIQYLAIYRVSPISSITHYAKVEKIEPIMDGLNKYILHFVPNSIVALPHPIIYECIYNAIQRPIYTNLKKLTSSKTIEDLKR